MTRNSPSGRARGFVTAIKGAVQSIANGVPTIIDWAGAAALPESNIEIDLPNDGVIIPRTAVYLTTLVIQWGAELNGADTLELVATAPGGVLAPITFPVVDTLDDTQAEFHTQTVMILRRLTGGTLVQGRVTQTSGGGAGNQALNSWTFTVCEV